jgi:hypothetical protein
LNVAPMRVAAAATALAFRKQPLNTTEPDSLARSESTAPFGDGKTQRRPTGAT